MSVGPQKQRLLTYVSTARPEQLTAQRRDWQGVRRALVEVAASLRRTGDLAPEALGGTSETSIAFHDALRAEADALESRAEKVGAVVSALDAVATLLAGAKQEAESRAMADLGDRPPPHRSPDTTDMTPEEIRQDASARSTADRARTDWEAGFVAQEERARELVARLDAAFLAAIPPMRAIHGVADPAGNPERGPAMPSAYVPPSTLRPPAHPSPGTGGPDDPRHVPTPGSCPCLPPCPRCGPGVRPPDDGAPDPIWPDPTDPTPSEPTPPDPAPGDPDHGSDGPDRGTYVAGSGGVLGGAALGAAGLAWGRLTGSSGAAGPTGAAAVGATSRTASSALGRGADRGGPRLLATGATGARSAGGGPGRGRQRGAGRDERARDHLVVGDDWLGDEDVAPGLLD